MKGFNIVSVLILFIFFLPIVIGFFEPFTRERVIQSIDSLFDNIEFLFGLLLSIFVTKKIFFEHGTEPFKTIYLWIPQNIKTVFYGRDVLTYLFAVPVLLLFVLLILRLVTNPLYRIVIITLSNMVFAVVNSMNRVFRRILSIVWSVPKAVFIVLVFSFILNFYAYYFSTPFLSKWMNESKAYQVIYNTALYPVLNSNIAKQIPVLVNDSFRNNFQGNDSTSPDNPGKIPSSRNIRVIEYFNGVTLDEAIRLTPEIDEAAQKIVGRESDSKKKARLIYQWICREIEYDYDKAEKISSDSRGIESGSKIAFNTRKGICFDFSSLYISMCRAVGLKVRLITGLGYSGVSWGDHAWNQVYCTEESKWINVDSTFGKVGNYFDKPDFKVDHKFAEVQGEW